MKSFDWLAALMARLTMRGKAEDELDEEIRSHFQMAVRDRIDRGEDPEAARLAAIREFGNVALTREVTRRMWTSAGAEWCRALFSDFRYALRTLAKSKGFAAVVVLILALGIGANTAVFSLTKAAFFKPIPGVANPSGLVVVAATTTAGATIPVSYPDYQYLRDRDNGLTALAASCAHRFSVGLGDHAEQGWGEIVSGNYFEVLGVRASLGRTLTPADDLAPGAHPVAVISTGLWQKMFGSDPHIIGRTIRIDSRPFTIVGVTQPGFRGSIVGLVLDIFIPIMMQPKISTGGDLLHERNSQWLVAFGRPRPGVGSRALEARLGILSAQLGADFPLREISTRARLFPLWKSPFGAQTYLMPVVSLLTVTAALVLLIVCANLANLMLARGVTRRKEIAVRLALGAGRARVVRLLLVENLLVSLAGAVAGLVLAPYLLGILDAGPDVAPFPMDLDTSTDLLVAGFTLLTAFGSALLFGLAPSWRSSRLNLAMAMKDEWSLLGTRGRLRGVLVASEIALSLLLLIGASLVVRSLKAADRADVGFDPHHVASLSLDLGPNGYDEARGRVFYDQLLEKVTAGGGIQSVTLAGMVPLRLIETVSSTVAIEGYQPRSHEQMTLAYNIVGPGYFRTLRIPLAAGREFIRRDDAHAPAAMVVNETMARRYWGSPANAIGRKVHVHNRWWAVVGVVRDIKYTTLTEEPRPYFYMPFLQNYATGMTVHVRAERLSPQLLERLREYVRELDPNLPVLEVRTLTEQIRFALFGYEMAASMLSAFGLLALALAAVGTYGLIAYAVRQSTREIGIRMALGAQTADVLRRFLARGIRLTVIGLILGLAGSLAATRLMSSLLYGVTPTDVVSFAAATLLVLAVSLVASLVPASRAARTDPLQALRHD